MDQHWFSTIKENKNSEAKPNGTWKSLFSIYSFYTVLSAEMIST